MQTTEMNSTTRRTSSLYSSMVEIILRSDKSEEEKITLLVELQKELKDLEIQKKEVQFKNQTIKWMEEQYISLSKEKVQETVYKLHYQQLLTIRAVIENYEKNFGEKLLKKNISLTDKWLEYLSFSEETFKPFKDAGLTIKQVSNTIAVIFKSHSADIHTIKVVEGLDLKARGLLLDNQLKIIELIIENSPWKDLISVE